MSAKEAAEWMLEEVQRSRLLDQETAAYQIKRRFGDDCVYINQNGNLAIASQVLKIFHKLTADDIIWERGTRTWRTRQQYDRPGRQQD